MLLTLRTKVEIDEREILEDTEVRCWESHGAHPPLAMPAAYTFVFSQVFKARWGGLDSQDR